MVAQVVNLSKTILKGRYSLVDEAGYGIDLRAVDKKLIEACKKINTANNNLISIIDSKSKIDSEVLLVGSLTHLKIFANALTDNSDSKSVGEVIAHSIINFENQSSVKYNIGLKEFNFSNPHIMGILNVTPDSFSDGGKYYKQEDAVNQALRMIDEGADIIDVGGESSSPGSESVSLEDEIARTIPVIKKIKQIRNDVVVSIDTTKYEVAKMALDCGANIINDISGLVFEPRFASLANKYESGLIIMHMKGTPKNMQIQPHYENLTTEIYDFLFKQTNIASSEGVSKIIVDPGIGFGKSVDDNFQIIRELENLKSLGYPIMIGLSRKSFIGKTLDLDIEYRDVSTNILESASLLNSARIIRTHNVHFAKQMVNLLTKII